MHCGGCRPACTARSMRVSACEKQSVQSLAASSREGVAGVALPQGLTLPARLRLEQQRRAAAAQERPRGNVVGTHRASSWQDAAAIARAHAEAGLRREQLEHLQHRQSAHRSGIAVASRFSGAFVNGAELIRVPIDVLVSGRHTDAFACPGLDPSRTELLFPVSTTSMRWTAYRCTPSIPMITQHS